MEAQMTDKKNGFMMYKSHWEAISDLEDKYLGQLMRAIFEYQIEGKIPEKYDIIYRDFKHIMAQFKMDDAKYEQVIQKRKESGATGGKQRVANQASASNSKQIKQDQANQADNDNDNVNDINNPIIPSSAKPQKPRKKTREDLTREQALTHYKTETEKARAAGPEADYENFRKLGHEICGTIPTIDCPEGMVKTVMRLPDQLTFEQYQNLCKKVGGHGALRDYVLNMHNKYEQYLTKSHSVNLIVQDWHRRWQKGGNPPAPQVSGGVAKVTKYGPNGE